MSSDICYKRRTSASNPPAAVAATPGQTDGQTDTRPFYDAYRILCGQRRNRNDTEKRPSRAIMSDMPESLAMT